MLCPRLFLKSASKALRGSVTSTSAGVGPWGPECALPAAGATLKVNPEERLSITELVNQLQEIAAARSVNPKSPISEVGPSRCCSEQGLRGPVCFKAETMVQAESSCPGDPRARSPGRRESAQADG